MDDRLYALLTEQMKHATDLLSAQIQSLEAKVVYQTDLFHQRLTLLEECMRDHEMRLRAATEGVTQFKLFSGLASGSSGLMSLVALIKAFLGG